MAGEKRWIRNADVVVTMDSDRRELAGADILAVAGRIESVGAGGPEDPAGWEVIEAGGCVVTPALACGWRTPSKPRPPWACVSTPLAGP